MFISFRLRNIPETPFSFHGYLTLPLFNEHPKYPTYRQIPDSFSLFFYTPHSLIKAKSTSQFHNFTSAQLRKLPNIIVDKTISVYVPIHYLEVRVNAFRGSVFRVKWCNVIPITVLLLPLCNADTSSATNTRVCLRNALLFYGNVKGKFLAV